MYDLNQINQINTQINLNTPNKIGRVYPRFFDFQAKFVYNPEEFNPVYYTLINTEDEDADKPQIWTEIQKVLFEKEIEYLQQQIADFEFNGFDSIQDHLENMHDLILLQTELIEWYQ